MAESDPPVDDHANDECDDNYPTEQNAMRPWRGRAKARHTDAIQALKQAMINNEERDELKSLRRNVVRRFNKILSRHDYIMTRLTLNDEGKKAEERWLADVSNLHQGVLSQADSHILSNFPIDPALSQHSRGSSRSSRSSRHMILASELAANAAALNLRQITSENEKRAEENERLRRQEMDAKQKELNNQAEREKIEAERKKREAEQELERQKLQNETIRRGLGEIREEEEVEEASASVSDNAIASVPAIRSSSIQSFMPPYPSSNTYPTPDFPLSLLYSTPTPSNTSFHGWDTPHFRMDNGARPRTTSYSGYGYPQVARSIPSTTTISSTVAPSSAMTSSITSPTVRSVDPTVATVSAPNVTIPTGSSVGPSAYRDPPVTLTSVPQSTRTQNVDTYSSGPANPPALPQNTTPFYGTPFPAYPYQIVTYQGDPHHHQPPTPSNLSAAQNTGRQAPWCNPQIDQMRGWGSYPPVTIGSHSSHAAYAPVYSPDSWIHAIGINQPADPSAMRNGRPPRTEIPKFNGDATQWPLFIQSFKSQVHDVIDNDAIRLAHLRNCLTPDIQSHLGKALANPGLYQYALKELQRKFGNPQVIAQALTSSLLSLRPFNDNDYSALKHFTTTLRSVVATLNESGYGLELHSSATLLQLVNKLPPTLKVKWANVSWKMQPRIPTVADLDWWLDNQMMAQYAMRAGSIQSSQPHERKGRSSDPPKRSESPKRVNPSIFTTTNIACVNCSGSHNVESCQSFKDLSVEGRAKIVLEKRLCYRCLSAGHIGSKCENESKCDSPDCKGRHHRLMHGAPRLYPKSKDRDKRVTFEQPPNVSSPNTSSSISYFNGSIKFSPSSNSGTLLPIVPVKIKTDKGSMKTYALLDTGSQVTLVKSWIVKSLKLNKTSSVSAVFGTINGLSSPRQLDAVSFDLTSIEEDVSYDMSEAMVVDSFDLYRKPVDLSKLLINWPHLAKVPFRPELSSIKDVGVIVGLDYPALHEVLDQRVDRLNHRAPRAIQTVFGWCLTGPISAPVHTGSTNAISLLVDNDSESQDDLLDDLVRNFLQSDQLVVRTDLPPLICADDRRALSILKSTVRHVGDRYEAGVLWKHDHPSMPDNERVAFTRLLSLERRLHRDPVLEAGYAKGIDDQVSAGFISKLTPDEASFKPKGRTWFLTHHPTFNPNKPGKFRMVHDGSFTFNGVSLNSTLLKGPDFLPSLPGILIRFRERQVAIVADIEKMFYQVLIKPDDRPAFRFLYRQPGSTGSPDVYQMNVHPFGAICSPAICSYVLRKAAADCGNDSDRVLNEVKDHFYVDNWLVSYDTEEEAIEMANIVYGALLAGGFKLTQWSSSHRNVRLSIPDPNSIDRNLDLDAVPVERTLGLRWNFDHDTFMLSIKTPQLTGRSKREMLRIISSIFDPLGFLTPIVFLPKLWLQELWRKSLGWDDEIPESLIDRLTGWISSLSSLQSLSIPRWYFSNLSSPTTTQLHVFADASESGYGSVAYLRRSYDDGSITTSFVFAKSRVAPLKFVSIARLELCAAVVAVRIGQFVMDEIRTPVDEIVYWTDSTTVISWITSTHYRFHVYVSNRIGEILNNSSPGQWNYIRSADNPADDLTRGLDPNTLSNRHRWFIGPPFLFKPREEWPRPPPIPSPSNDDPEIRDAHWIGLATRKTDCFDALIDAHSRIDHLYRVTALIMRWPSNRPLPKAERIIGDPTVDEVANAKKFLIRRVQSDSFRTEIANLTAGVAVERSSPLVKLTPFLNADGILCVGGRIENAPLPFHARHQIILPSRSHLTNIIIWKAHLDVTHLSTEQTLHRLRGEFWILKGRITVQRVLNRCLLCKRHHPKPLRPMMANLPKFRFEPNLPIFSRVGVDYFGPIEVKVLRSTVKRYGCLFTCLSSRAVDILLAFSLTTDSFLSCLTRFESRHGVPMSYHSDNGTNFVGAQRELAECLAELNQTKIAANLCRRSVKWYFNPPVAPHHGGVWERMVRTAKSSLRHALRGHKMTDEALITALELVTNIINSRPLTSVNNDPRNPEPLTPNHLLLGRANPYLPPAQITESDFCSKQQWRQAQAFAVHFWKRWLEEFVPSLTERQKWTEEQENLQPGDLVMLLNASKRPGDWPLARVSRVMPGPDGVVRSVWIWTGDTEYHRPVTSLCLIEAAQND